MWRRQDDRPASQLRRAAAAARARPGCARGRCRARGRRRGRRRGTMSIRQQKRSAPRGAVRTHRLSGGLAPKLRAQQAQAAVQERGAGRAVVLEALAAAARGEHELEADAATRTGTGARPRRRSRRSARGGGPPRDEVLEQVGAHRAHRVRAEALALAGDGGRHEVQRVELAACAAGAGLAALVDAEVHVRRAVVRAHPLAPDLDGRDDLLDRQLGERLHRLGALTMTSWRAARGERGEELGLRRAGGGSGASGRSEAAPRPVRRGPSRLDGRRRRRARRRRRCATIARRPDSGSMRISAASVERPGSSRVGRSPAPGQRHRSA